MPPSAKLKASLLLAALLIDQCVSVTYASIQYFSDSSYVNEWDGYFDNRQSDAFMCGVETSVHSNAKEDRRWRFRYCHQDTPAFIAETSLEVTPYDDYWTRECAGSGKALIGGTSTHDNGMEDRVWTWYCGTLDSSKYNVSACGWSDWANSYDATFSYYCPNNGVMTGLESQHDNSKQDRRWRYRCCRIVNAPTPRPTSIPSQAPTPAPTDNPTPSPTSAPTAIPTRDPTEASDCELIPIDAFLTSCSDEFAANELDIETLQSAQTAATERVDAMEMELTERMDEFADAAEVMRTNITGNGQRMDDFDVTVDAVQTEVTSNGKRIDELGNTTDVLQNDQTAANERLDVIETDIAGNEQRMDEMVNTVGAMQTEVTANADRIDELGSNAQELHANITAKFADAADRSAVDQELGELQNRVQELEAWKEGVVSFEAEASARSQMGESLPIGNVASHNAVTSTEGKDTIIVALVVANVLLIIGCLVAAFTACFGGKGAMGYGKMFPSEI